MIKVSNKSILKAPTSMRALLSIDADVAAERVIVMNRDTGELYYNFKLTNSIHTFTVPYANTINRTLLIGILDDDHTYNCKFVDGVLADNVNVNAI